MATKSYELAAKIVLSALIIAAAGLSCPPPAGADDPESPGGQGQDACAGGEGLTLEEQQQRQQACAAGIANRAVNEAQSAANQANQAANQANQNGDRPPNDMITDHRCSIFNGVPTLGEVGGVYVRTATPFDSPMEGKPCWYAFGVKATH